MASTTDLTANIVPKLCINNCGFFGNLAFDGLCSWCYSQQKTNSIAEVEPTTLEHNVSVEDKVVIESTKSMSSPVDNLSLTTQSRSTIKNKSSKKSRCPNCKKTMGILQYPCACGGYFCSYCRYSNEHQCTIDYKAVGRKTLAKSNPQVIADRVHNRQ